MAPRRLVLVLGAIFAIVLTAPGAPSLADDDENRAEPFAKPEAPHAREALRQHLRCRIEHGPDSVSRAVRNALDWLQDHQRTDGSWSTANYIEIGTTHGRDNDYNSADERLRDPSTDDFEHNGLALLAFTFAGFTAHEGPYAAAIERATRYILGRQGSDGRFTSSAQPENLLDHARATLALILMHEADPRLDLGERIERALAYIAAVQHRNENDGSAPERLGWGLAPRMPDTLTTGTMLLPLLRAVDAGYSVDDASIEGGTRWLDRTSTDRYGRLITGYLRAPTSPRGRGLNDQPPSPWPMCDGVNVYVRALVSEAHRPAKRYRKQADRLLESVLSLDPPPRGTTPLPPDYTAWLWMARAIRSAVSSKPRAEWREAALRSLIMMQHRRGDRTRGLYGSWDPIDVWSAKGGAVYATATNALTLMEIALGDTEVSATYPARIGEPRKASDRPVFDATVAVGVFAVEVDHACRAVIIATGAAPAWIRVIGHGVDVSADAVWIDACVELAFPAAGVYTVIVAGSAPGRRERFELVVEAR